MAGRGMVLCAAVVCMLAYWLYMPLPNDMPFSWNIQWYFAAMRVQGTAANIGAYLGLGSRINISRSLLEYYGAIGKSFTEYKDDELSSQAELDGVPVWMYRPPGAKDDLLPAMVYYHGGGWVFASARYHNTLHKHLAKQLSMVVVSVDYRMAPEVKFPVPFEDSLRTTKYFLQHAAEFGVDASRIVLAGDSAGGNLAAAVSTRLRDEQFTPRNKAQVLIYPALQAIDTNTPSYQQQTFDDFVMNKETMAWYWSMYITGEGKLMEDILKQNHTSPDIKKRMATTHLNHKRIPHALQYSPYVQPVNLDYGSVDIWESIKDVVLNPYFSPLMAEDVSDLPPTFVWTVQHDVLRDEGIWYAQRLKEAGNDVTHYNSPGGFHPMLELIFFLPMTDEALGKICEFLREKL